MFIKVILVVINIDDIVQQIEHVTGQVLKNHQSELQFLQNLKGSSIERENLINNLTNTIESDFIRISYSDR